MNNNHQIFQFSQITDLIYLGANLCCTAIPHVKVLLDLGIKADIDLEVDSQEQTPSIDTYLWLPVKDHFAPTLTQFDTGVAVIDSLVKNGKKIYLHCKNGHGRSLTLLAAYFISQGIKVDEAIDMIRSKRPEIHITEVQREALQKFKNKKYA